MNARILLGLGLIASMAVAVPEQYSPFEAGEQARPFRLIALESELGEYSALPRHDDFVHKAERVTHLRIDWAADYTAGATLSRNGTQLLSGPLKGYGSPMAGAGVYVADLNADGLSDYVIITYSDGCGLASLERWITFLLSTSNGYISTSVSCWQAEQADFIDIKGRAYLVHASFVPGGVGRDGKAHNYWVYNLLGFSGTSLVLANDMDRRFPKWVWYSFAPNHRDTDQLAAGRRRLSLKQILEAD